ncbi:MAG: DUF1232 domain-containing protein [Candidatus Marinimicrobia bacterium]|nr:DUF1232 domain-containing protein [Candidatus Neomarinimicrobiota bacterium]MCF7829635.1 DUF1232 domain-containing protein [Candidatus Neomarinimicrobiota bacterium]MCF7879795.1 DUF1232 domain-containing protein [Candidatus Neomarinimicrobiota bacterium]
MDQEKIDRYYEKFDNSVKQWDENVEKYREKYSLLKVLPIKTAIRIVKAGPVTLHLLISLLNHEQVSKKTKRRVSATIAYFILPFDVIPEAIVGPVGYVDDIVVALTLIDSLLNGDNEEEKQIITELWRGTSEELTALRGIIKGIDVVRYIGKYLQKIMPSS